jgi:uncharacterized protein (DUF2062 family)
MRSAARSLWNRFKRLLRHIVEQKDTPESIALGLAVGTFIALTPTMGFQVVLAAITTTICRANRLAAIAAVYITNPFTMIPIYGSTYLVGAWILNYSPNRELFEQALNVEGLWNKLFAMLGGLGRDIILPLWVGGVVLGLVVAIPVYPLARRLIQGHRVVQAHKRREKLQRERDALEEEMSGEHEPPEA